MYKVPLCEQEKKIWYSKFYALPFEGLRESDSAVLDAPMDPAKALPIGSLLEFLRVKDEKETVENGYCIGPDGHSYIVCTEYYPEFTVPMMVWWFQFLNHHPKDMPIGVGNLRYKIWCPADHWNHGLLDPDDPNSGLFINETLDLGAGTMERIEVINRSYTEEDIGLTPEMAKAMKDAGYAWMGGKGYGHGLPGGMGINIFKPVPEGGIKWSSIGWGGYQMKHGKPVELLGVNPPTYAEMKRELSHNIAERRHLHTFLGELYAVQSRKPLWED